MSHCLACLCRVAGSGACGGTESWITTPCRYLSSGSACPATLTRPTSATMANLSSLKVCQSCLSPTKSVAVRTQHPHPEQPAQCVTSKPSRNTELSFFYGLAPCLKAQTANASLVSAVFLCCFSTSEAEANMELFKCVSYKHKMGSETQICT